MSMLIFDALLGPYRHSCAANCHMDLAGVFAADDARRRASEHWRLHAVCEALHQSPSAPPQVRLVARQMTPHRFFRHVQTPRRVLTADTGWIVPGCLKYAGFLVTPDGQVFELDEDGVYPGTFDLGDVPTPPFTRLDWPALGRINQHLERVLAHRS